MMMMMISNFMKIRLVGAELLHAGGRTDRRTDRHEEANSRFSQFLRTCLKPHLFSSLATFLCNMEERAKLVDIQFNDTLKTEG